MPRRHKADHPRDDAGRAAEGEPRPKLRTSRELYDQIRWDPRLDAAAFVIGYETREAGTQEMPLLEFVPEGDIPWHRVQYIRRGNTAVWDRASRVDLLGGERHAPSTSSSTSHAAPTGPVDLHARPVHRSAVAVIPPEDVWPPIEAIRRRHDRLFDRWMPHINLLYGFLPEAAFAEARDVLTKALREVAPFEVTLDELRRFQHRASATVWLHPRSSPEGALEALQARLQALFPQCTEQSSASAAGFIPHLSLAQVPLHPDRPPGEDDVEPLLAEWRRILPITFHVRTIHLISRREDGPFAIRHVIPLVTPLE